VHKVMVSSVVSKTNSPVYSVLDQRKHSGPVYIDGQPVASGNVTSDSARSLWHANTGYIFDDVSNDEKGLTISVSTGNRTGAWTAIGASLQPPVTVDLFAAYIQHDSTNLTAPISYTVYPAITQGAFASLALQDQQRAPNTNCSCSSTSRIVTIQNDASISAVFDTKHSTAMVVFWASSGGSVAIPSTPLGYTVQSNRAVTLIVSLERNSFTVSDPSQTLGDVTLSFQSDGLVQNSVTVVFDNQTLGKSVTQPLP